MSQIRKTVVSGAPQVQIRFRDILQQVVTDATAALEPGGKASNRPDAAELRTHLTNLASLARQLDAELEYLEGKSAV